MYNNEQLHITKVIRDKKFELGWSVLPHLTYSSDLNMKDYYFFGCCESF